MSAEIAALIVAILILWPCSALATFFFVRWSLRRIGEQLTLVSGSLVAVIGLVFWPFALLAAVYATLTTTD